MIQAMVVKAVVKLVAKQVPTIDVIIQAPPTANG